MAKMKKTFSEKMQEEHPTFVQEVIGLSVDQLDKRLADLAKGLDESESAMEKDTELEDARALVSELSGPYRDVRKAIKMKSKYVINLLKEKGAL